jgi:hypothetical protein
MTAAMRSGLARLLWHVLEPYHAVVYFAPEAKQLYADAGLKGGWMGYFASRSAAMGPVPADVVIATFFNFHPRMVRRAIPDAWTLSAPERVLAARLAVADVALRRLLGASIDATEVAEAADIAQDAADACSEHGRPLFAAHASLPWPETPHLMLWHAATLLREHRGDGHVATLVAEGIDGCECHVLAAAAGKVDPVSQRAARGWSEEEWDAAEERLRERHLVDPEGKLTDRGRALHEDFEDRTDQLALAPYATIGQQRAERLEQIMLDISNVIASGGGVPFPNPMALPRS